MCYTGLVYAYFNIIINGFEIWIYHAKSNNAQSHVYDFADVISIPAHLKADWDLSPHDTYLLHCYTLVGIVLLVYIDKSLITIWIGQKLSRLSQLELSDFVN